MLKHHIQSPMPYPDVTYTNSLPRTKKTRYSAYHHLSGLASSRILRLRTHGLGPAPSRKQGY